MGRVFLHAYTNNNIPKTLLPPRKQPINKNDFVTKDCLSGPQWNEFGACSHRIAEIETRLVAVVWCKETGRVP